MQTKSFNKNIYAFFYNRILQMYFLTIYFMEYLVILFYLKVKTCNYYPLITFNDEWWFIKYLLK